MLVEWVPLTPVMTREIKVEVPVDLFLVNYLSLEDF